MSKLRARALLGSAASTVLLGALISAGMVTAATAQNKAKPANAAAAAAAAAADGEGTEVEQVVVTGTFLRGTPATAVVPVEGVNLEELRDRGSPSNLDFIKGLSEVGSVAGEANRSNAYAIGAQSVNLRDLGANRTVVVFNGRRFPETFSFSVGRFNNIAQIPNAAIGRVEVLKDGGATTYGADAVGGVINYITRRNLDGLEVTANYRFIKDSDGDYDFSISAGKIADKWNIMGILGYNKRSVLQLSDRDWAITPYLMNGTAWSGASNPGGFEFQIPAPVGSTTTTGSTTTLAAGSFGVIAAGTFNSAVNPFPVVGGLTNTLLRYNGNRQMGATGIMRDPACEPLGGYNGWSATPSAVCYTRTTDFSHLVEDQTTWNGYAEFNYEFSSKFRVHAEAMYYGLDIPNIPIDAFAISPQVFPLIRSNDTPSGVLQTNASGALTGAAQSVPTAGGGTTGAYFVSGQNPAVGYLLTNQLQNAPGSASINAFSQAQIDAIVQTGRAALPSAAWRPFGLGAHPAPDLNTQHNYTHQYRYTVEFSGDIGKFVGGTWDWSFAYTTNQMWYFYRAHDILVDRMQSALNGFGGANCNGLRAGTTGSTCQYFNPFSSSYATNQYNGATNPYFVGTGTFAGYAPGKGLQNDVDLVRWMYVPIEQDREGTYDIFDLLLRGELDYHLWSKDPIQLAVGAQYREFNEINDLSEFADEATNPCATPGITFCATANSPVASRRGANLFGFRQDITRRKPVESAFAEVKVPVSDKLNVQISTRYEKFFSDVGAQDNDVFVTQGAVRYQALPWLAFRATAGQTFANADPPPPAVPNTAPNQVLATALGGASVYTSANYSNTGVKPETGFNYNIGAIFQVGDITATLDYYDIKLDDVLRGQTAAQIIQAATVPGTTGATALMDCANQLLTVNNPLFGDSASPTGRPFIQSSVACVGGTTTVKEFISGARVNFFGQQGQQTTLVNGGTLETGGIDGSIAWRKADVFGGDLSVQADTTYIIKYKQGAYTINGIPVAAGFDNGIGSINNGPGKNLQRVAQYRGSVTLNFRRGRHNFNWRTQAVSSIVNDIDSLFQASNPTNANIPNAQDFVIPGANLTCSTIISPPVPDAAGTGTYGVPGSPIGVSGAIAVTGTPVGFDPCQNTINLSAMKIPANFSSDFTYRLLLPANTTLSLTVSNVFDTDPRFSRDANGYDAGSGSPLGRTYRVGVTKKW